VSAVEPAEEDADENEEKLASADTKSLAKKGEPPKEENSKGE
jgi:hypothetical protein